MTDEKKHTAIVPDGSDAMANGADGGSKPVPLAPRPPASWTAKGASVFFALCLVATIVAGFFVPNSGVVVGVGVPAFLLAMCFTRLELFESVEGAGFKLKMKQVTEAAEQATARAQLAADDARKTALDAQSAAAAASAAAAEAKGEAALANATIAQLRELSTELAFTSLSAYANQGRAVGVRKLAERLTVARAVDARLTGIQCDPKRVARATRPVRKGIATDLRLMAEAAAPEAARAAGKHAEYGAAFQQLELRCLKERREPTPAELRAVFDIGAIPDDAMCRQDLDRLARFLERGELQDGRDFDDE